MKRSDIRVATPSFDERELAAVEAVLRSGDVVSGERVAELERRFAAFVGAADAVAVSSGTAALQIALTGMGLGPKDEVIVPSLTFFATVGAVLLAGARPVFADIDDDYCLCPESAARQVTPRTRAILPVHLFGYSADLDALSSLARQHSLDLVEDCAQAIGTTWRGRRVGSFGRAGAFSFFATKNMTTGEGGMITTSDAELARRARLLRSHGLEGRDDHLLLGTNHRMNEIGAAIGLVQLDKLPELNQRRQANSRYLCDRIAHLEWLRIQAFAPHVGHSWFWCPVGVDEERLGLSTLELREELHRRRIGTRHRYREPLYRQPLLREKSPFARTYPVECPFYGKTVRYEDLEFPNAERLAGRILGLPNHPGLTERELDSVVEALEEIGSGRAGS